ARRYVQMVDHGDPWRDGLVVIGGRDRESWVAVRIRVGHAGSRAEGDDVSWRGRRMAVEIAGCVVVSVTIDRRAAILHNCAAKIRVPRHAVARSGHAIRAGTTIIGCAELATQALAPHHVPSGIYVLHVRRTECPQIHLASRVDAMR